MCLFCQKFNEQKDILFENDSVFVIKDLYPVTKGHVLIVTKRHITDYFLTTKKEVLDIDQAIRFMKKSLTNEYNPDGFNIGVNNGEAAGQTIMHLHIHLIPRYKGDMIDPTGGVRGVIPGKQKY